MNTIISLVCSSLTPYSSSTKELEETKENVYTADALCKKNLQLHCFEIFLCLTDIMPLLSKSRISAKAGSTTGEGHQYKNQSSTGKEIGLPAKNL